MRVFEFFRKCLCKCFSDGVWVVCECVVVCVYWRDGFCLGSCVLDELVEFFGAACVAVCEYVFEFLFFVLFECFCQFVFVL